MFEKCDLSLRNIRNFLLLQTWSGSDATGNVMAVYSSKDGGDNLLLAEQHIYGASRLGMRTADLNVSDPSVSSVSAGLIGSGYLDNFERGRKFFELSNHLGNSLSRTCGILVTISDRKILVKTGSGSESNGGCDAGTAAEELTLTERGTATSMVAKNRIRLLPGFSSGSGDSFTAYIDNSRPGCELADNPTANPDQYYYIADVISANDYYPGSMELPGRTYSATNQYRYGYQGSEKDKELNTNTYTTFFREIDTRIGRWWSVDPKTNSGESPYVAMGNNPLWFNDIRGDSIPTKFYDKGGVETNDIPSVVQNQFQQEYGITLGYTNGKLYKAGDFKSNNTISQDAKSDWEKVLGTENPTQSLTFGYSLALSLKPTIKGELDNPVVMGQWDKFQNTAYVDLADFDNNGEILGLGISGPQNHGVSLSVLSRIDNLARVTEHEYLCHGVKGLTDDGRNGLGDVEYQINIYRRQMGVPQRVSYGYSSERKTLPNFRTMEKIKHYVRRDAIDGSGNVFGLEYERTKLEEMKFRR